MTNPILDETQAWVEVNRRGFKVGKSDALENHGLGYALFKMMVDRVTSINKKPTVHWGNFNFPFVILINDIPDEAISVGEVLDYIDDLPVLKGLTPANDTYGIVLISRDQIEYKTKNKIQKILKELVPELARFKSVSVYSLFLASAYRTKMENNRLNEVLTEQGLKVTENLEWGITAQRFPHRIEFNHLK